MRRRALPTLVAAVAAPALVVAGCSGGSPEPSALASCLACLVLSGLSGQ